MLCKGCQISRIAVIGGDDLTGAGDREFDRILGAWNLEALLVGNRERDKAEIFAIRGDFGAVWLEQEPGGGAGGLHDILRPLLAILVRDDLELTGLIDDIVPA